MQHQDPYFAADGAASHRCAGAAVARGCGKEGGGSVVTVSQPASETPVGRLLAVADMWPSLAIAAMWLVVLLDALFGPDFVSSNPSGFTRIPSAIGVAFFAYLGTRVVARYGFGHGMNDNSYRVEVELGDLRMRLGQRADAHEHVLERSDVGRGAPR